MICRWKRTDRRAVWGWLTIFAALFALVCVVLSALYMTGIRVNITPSLPCGIWRVSKADLEALKIGDTVMVDRLAVPGIKFNLLKDIAAVAGDVMTLKENSVYRNGQKIPLSTVFPVNSEGVKIWHIDYPLTVPEHHVWLGSRVERAYDSRYFGPVPVQAVKGKATLLWAW